MGLTVYTHLNVRGGLQAELAGDRASQKFNVLVLLGFENICNNEGQVLSSYRFLGVA